MSTSDLLGLQGAELLSAGADAKTRRVPAAAALAGKTIGLYFSAHWCPPCRNFTPVLAEVYERVQQKHKEFEVLFVSADRSAAQFEEYFAQMPWLAVPWEQTALRHKISTQFGVAGIPRLVILGPDGQVMASDARSAVMADRQGQRFPWSGAAGPSGLAALFSSPRGLLLLFMLLYWLSQWLTKKPQ